MHTSCESEIRTNMHNIHLLLQINVPKDKIKNYKYTLKLTKKPFQE